MEYICPVCGQPQKKLTPAHCNKHGMTLREFQLKYHPNKGQMIAPVNCKPKAVSSISSPIPNYREWQT